MSIVIWFQCDQGVRYGTCGEKTFAHTDSVAAAVDVVESAGWYVGPPSAEVKHRRVRCPGHGGRRQ